MIGNGRFHTAIEALEEAETLITAEAAQLHLAAELAGMDFDDFMAALAAENGFPE